MSVQIVQNVSNMYRNQ